MKNNNQPYTDQFYSQGNQNTESDLQQSSGSINTQNENSGAAASSAPKNNSGPDSLVELPKGGGAIKGIGEKFEANPLTGTASISVPIAMSQGRGGFTPQLGLSYDSGSGNSPYGLGWNIGLPSISRKTDKGIPRYFDFSEDLKEQDTFILSGAEDLVRKFNADGELLPPTECSIGDDDYQVYGFIPRTEGLFARIEMWLRLSDKDIHWRATTKDNTTTVYGQSESARIADPTNTKKVFKWLIERTTDHKGNIILYEFKAENSDNITNHIYEKNRLNGTEAFANKYLKRVFYANDTMVNIDDDLSAMDWHMQLLLDYGEHNESEPTVTEEQNWTCRLDPFSTHKQGFEVRTWRLCKRMLMFHKFSDLGNDWTLVKSTDLSHNTDNWQNGEPIPALTLLNSATHKGYRDGNSKSYPPLTFNYSQAEAPGKIHSFDSKDMENLASGVGADKNYQWIDLYNEGLSGVLVKNEQAWYYKSNYGDKQFTDSSLTEPDIELGALKRLDSKPSMATAATSYTLGDIDGNGQTDISILSGHVKGYQELDKEGKWENFQYFNALPNLNWQDPNLKMIDLNGDGHADILITENHCFSCYFSKAKEGFEAAIKIAKEMDENQGPRLVFNDGTQTIFTADMSGDGLSDLVRINNGSVDYWPNMGYGRFGKKVSMKDAPRLDYPEQFDPARIRLADIDGSGTTDIIYLGRNTYVSYNLAGNSWTSLQILSIFPPFDSASTVTVMDLLGKGSSCIVWSTSLPNHANRMQYVELTGGRKPWLLQEMNNQMGGIRQFEYAPSTKFYIQDKKNNTPWISKLGFPVQVLEKTITIDEITQSTYTNRYAYHHGYFDGQEREFRGFGMVEQWDTEDYQIPSGGEENGDIPPVYTKTWFHTGYFKDRETIAHQYAQEYFNDDTEAWLLPDTQLPESLSAEESREACRVLKGSVLRKEVYAVDGTDKENLPYTVEEKSYDIQALQNISVNKHGVFLVSEAETISYHYERNISDPRIAHRLVMTVDEYGNIKEECQLSYPRRGTGNPDEQDKLWAKYDVKSFINHDDIDFYRLGVPVESKSYEMHNFSFSGKCTKEDVNTHITSALLLEYQETPGTTAAIRTLAHGKQYYYNEALNGTDGFGTIASHGLPNESQQLAYTSGLLDDIKAKNIKTDGYHNDLLQAADLENLLSTDGAFLSNTDGIWQLSERQTFSNTAFYLPISKMDAFGHSTEIQYDVSNLLMSKIVDEYSNDGSTIIDETLVSNDYTSMQAKQITDINGNESEVAFDALGMVTATAIKGKLETEGDTIEDPTVSMSYDLHQWKDEQKPVYVHTQARETHQDSNSDWLQSYTYSDGLGRELQTKVQAEDGDAWQIGFNEKQSTSNRWTSTGRKVYNNKGKVFKQYEPWFSNTHEYVDESNLNFFQLEPITMYYDPLGRIIKTKLPDDNITKVEFDAWLQKNYDQNDTNNTTDHYDTPQVQHLDSLGRLFLTQDDNGVEDHPDYVETRQKYNIAGQVEQVKDAKGRWMTQNIFNMLGEPIYTENIDSGRRWQLSDVAQKPIYNWDNRGHQTEQEYDPLQRPISESLRLSVSAVKKTQKTTYGTTTANNSKGQIIEHYDQSGKTTIGGYDFKGNLLSLTTQMLTDYKNTIDWTDSPSLDANHSYIQAFVYDAMNRPMHITKPDATVETYTYNKAGLLEEVHTQVKGTTSVLAVTGISYNEKGQRTEIFYGNGSKTKYEYDEETFRLNRLLTTRNTGIDILQDINYTYDPVGNISQITDNAQQTHYYGNSVIAPTGTYTYDALYRLKTATGRELTSLQMPSNTDFVDNIALPNTASNAMQNYTQQFEYDELGNMMQMKSVGNWTRNYYYDFANNTNQLLGHTDGTTEYTYDEHGNMLSMPHLSTMVWDYKDELKEVDLGGGGTAHYVYDAGGERVRKVIEKTGGIVEERVYLGGYEVYRKSVAGSLDFERETLHVSDDQKKIVSIETKTKENATSIQNPVPSIRYQYDNHLGSAALELDDTAAIISYEEYHPFGTTSYRSGRTETEVSLKRYKYVGKERDDETGLYYYGARYYATWICRFVSVDPLAGKFLFYTPYQYTGNNPVTFTDLDGAETTENEITNVKPNGQQTPHFMMYETADHAGLISHDAVSGKLKDNIVGNYRITPYFETNQEGNFSLSYYTAGRDISVGQDGEQQFREEWIISPSGLDEFKTKEERWWNPLQQPSKVANMVYNGGFEDFEKELQLGNYGNGIWGYGKAQWTNPEKLVGGATAGIAAFEAMATKTLYRGVNESHPGYSNALEGKVSPRGGKASPSQHNAGNTNSSYSSWTTNIEVARNYALRPDGMGAVLKIRTNKALPSPSLKSVQLKQAPSIIINEAEMLMKGNVSGAKVYKTN